MNNRRLLLKNMAALLVTYPLATLAEKGPLVQVYKSRTCNCCSKWVDHMIEAGFTVEATNVDDVGAYKLEFGLPLKLQSCHTAMVEGYIVEGHVPADDVIRLLREKPELKGIAVPGMPIGSPGMEGPNPDTYQVIAFDKERNLSVWAVHGPNA